MLRIFFTLINLSHIIFGHFLVFSRTFSNFVQNKFRIIFIQKAKNVYLETKEEENNSYKKSVHAMF